MAATLHTIHKHLCQRTHLTYTSHPFSSSSSKDRYVKPSTGLRKYLGQKLFGFIAGYEHILQTRFPRTFKIYQVFSIGTKELYNDISLYMKVSSQLRNGKTVRNLTFKELEKYHQAPKDMVKVAPVLLVAALPFTNYIVFPLAYLFPQWLLTPQFWSLQQKVEFSSQALGRRLDHYRPVFRCLQLRLSYIDNPALRQSCHVVFYKLGSGWHPTKQEILEVRPLFHNYPYSFKYMSSSHMYHLCKLQGLSSFWIGRKWRLMKHATFLHELDLALLRDGLTTLSLEDLRSSCFLRGINPQGLPKEELVNFLSNWIGISSQLSEREMSLLLHCPVFLSYNSPSNWNLKTHK